ncbi:hypothetical protein [Pseudonocardia spinosispora]|uniref:hypothetical protein n=1 Tax=Pseudonocardia spinosispora TaxID=103441 RepID=UPI000417D35D|nr:hypothetical protein [Pseudonocardia spinosispora]
MLMARLLARMPDLRQRVQTEHVPDAHGNCQECGVAQWPCELYEIASRADELQLSA